MRPREKVMGMRNFLSIGVITTGVMFGMSSLVQGGQPVKLVPPSTVIIQAPTSKYKQENLLDDLRNIRLNIKDLQLFVFGGKKPPNRFQGRKPNVDVRAWLIEVATSLAATERKSVAVLNLPSQEASALRDQIRLLELDLNDLNLKVFGDSGAQAQWITANAKRLSDEAQKKSEANRSKQIAEAERVEKARLESIRNTELAKIEAESKAKNGLIRMAKLERQKRLEAERKLRLAEAKEKLVAPLKEKHRNSIAVIIGNKSYKGRTPEVSFAHNDANAMRRFVINKLGYRDGNILDLRDASRNEIAEVFGNDKTHEGKLYDWVKPGQSDVIVFYSGHGVPGLNDKRPYLLPVDGNANRAEITGFPVDVLYKNLSLTPARTVTVFLDACFSGESPKGMLIRGTSGVSVKPMVPKTKGRMTVITAAQGDQFASWDEKAKLGLFTKHLLEALNGKADGKRFGNLDGKVSVKEVRKYLDDEMTYQARRTWGRHQRASVRGSDDTVLASVIMVPVIKAETPTITHAVSVEEMDATYVAIRTANLRAQPSTKSKIVGSLITGKSVNVTGRVKGKNWYRLDSDTFVFGSLIEPIDSEDIAAWGRIKDSKDGNDFKTYVARFPQGRYSSVAKRLVDALEPKKQVASVTTAPKVATSPSVRPAVGVFPKKHRLADTFKDCSKCPEMVIVPSGVFQMNERSSGRAADLGPEQRVAISKPFAVGRYEVTFDEWDSCVDAGECGEYEADDNGWGRGRRPVINVSWNDAKAYIEWLSETTGNNYRLPSEAEWIYVAKAWEPGSYHTDNGLSEVTPVGSYPANAFGLHDVRDNVWEWLKDCWTKSRSSIPADGTARVSGFCLSHGARGGSLDLIPTYARKRSAIRKWLYTDLRADYLGFRVARDLN